MEKKKEGEEGLGGKRREREGKERGKKMEGFEEPFYFAA